jgi:hypothetical protein
MNVQNSTMVPLTRSGSLLTRQYISSSEQRAGRERLTLILRGVERLSPDEIEEGNIIFDLVFRDAEQLTMIGRTTQMPAFRKPWNTANTDPSPDKRTSPWTAAGVAELRANGASWPAISKMRRLQS